jgi:putative membrane protein
MVNVRPDSITNIHKRWTITRLNPSSYKISIAISLASAALIVTLSFLYGANGIESNNNNYALSLFYGISAILALSFLDYLALYRTPTNKISKIFHVEGFGNLLWSVVLTVGIVIDSLFGYNSNSNKYLLEGMLVVAGFRIAIFRSVFGAGLIRAVGVSLIEPILFVVILLSPWQFYNLIFQYSTSFIVGIFFVIWAVIWSIKADRAGRPHVLSTFNLLQAFLSAWTEQKGDKMEAIAEARAKDNHVTSYVMKFECNDVNQKEVCLVIPGVHPGPFKPVGGSNLPYELFRIFAGRALVVHSPSDHSLNIPSRNEMTKYLLSFSMPLVFTKGSTCTEPLQIKRGDFIVTGIAFGSVCLVILSTSSRGMEDVPDRVSSSLQDYASNLGFSKTLVVDSHNAIGGPLSANDQHDLIVCAREILDKIKDSRQYRFGVGFASHYRRTWRNDSNLGENIYQLYGMEDLGPGGLAVIALEVMNKKYVIGWADSNNMESQVRDAVVSNLKSHGFYMLEVCTSDTHFTSGKRTRHGYYSLGTVTGTQQITDYFRELVAKSFADIKECSFSLLRIESNIKVMGKGQFDDYSKALDSSMSLTKIFLAISAAAALLMLLLT